MLLKYAHHSFDMKISLCDEMCFFINYLFLACNELEKNFVDLTSHDIIYITNQFYLFLFAWFCLFRKCLDYEKSRIMFSYYC